MCLRVEMWKILKGVSRFRGKDKRVVLIYDSPDRAARHIHSSLRFQASHGLLTLLGGTVIDPVKLVRFFSIRV